MIEKEMPGSLSYKQQCALEVEWYEKHGKFPSRITRDSQGVRYVIGDFTWNERKTSENIHRRMANYVLEKTTGLKR